MSISKKVKESQKREFQKSGKVTKMEPLGAMITLCYRALILGELLAGYPQLGTVVITNGSRR